MDYNIFLKEKQLKVTKARVAVLRVLFSNKYVTAEDIFEECKNEGIDINQSTVYRTLDAFVEKKIIEKYPLREGVFAYEVHVDSHKHLIKCNICSKEIEIPCPMKQVESLVQRETGFTLTEHNLVLQGVCKECHRK